MYLDANERIFFCNKKMETIRGLSRQTVIGRHWSNILYPEASSSIQQQMLKAVIDDVVTYNRPNNFEGLIVDSSGRQIQVVWDIVPIFSENNILEGILFVGSDITELREKETALRKIDEMVKGILSSIQEYALYVTNLDEKITYYAMGAEKMFGWKKDEIIFKQVSLLHSEEDRVSLLPSIFERAKNLGRLELELELMRKDKETFPVILTVNPLLDDEGKITGYVFMAKDITERRKLEYQIFQAEKMAAIGQLAAGMAHEINNPLFVISGRLEMLLEDGGISEQMRNDLKIIREQADRIRKLVDSLLKFSRKSVPKFETININEVIEGVLPLLSYHKLPEAKVTIEKHFAPDIDLIKGDLNQLQEVFLNLLINAHQAMPTGGKVTITTKKCQDSFVEVRISDTGTGINPKDMKNIFMPFFSTKKEGTGLGLSICYNIIKNHNGNIDVESQPGQGTTFIIKFPCLQQS